MMDSKGILHFSAIDLAGHLSCKFLTQLDAEVARGVRAKPKPIAIATSRATSKASSFPKVMPGSPRPSTANGNALADAAGAISFFGALTGSAMR